jgi:hypothetical protein
MGLWYPILNVVKLEIKDSSRPYGARKTVFGRGPRISSGAIFISSLREEGSCFQFRRWMNHLLHATKFIHSFTFAHA